jgi:Protein kinase domain
LYTDGEDYDNGLRHHFEVSVHVFKPEDISQDPHDQGANDGAGYRSAAAGETGSSNDNCGNGVEFISTCLQDGSKLATNSFPRSLASRFRLECRIGRGGMGVVYEANDLQLQRKVAVKLILEDWIKDSAALDRFRHEPHVLAGFQHPNVVTLFDAGVTSGGRPFLEELNYRAKLPVGEFRAIVRQLCSALSAAHRRSLMVVLANVDVVDKLRFALLPSVRMRARLFGSIRDSVGIVSQAGGAPS